MSAENIIILSCNIKFFYWAEKYSSLEADLSSYYQEIFCTTDVAIILLLASRNTCFLISIVYFNVYGWDVVVNRDGYKYVGACVGKYENLRVCECVCICLYK